MDNLTNSNLLDPMNRYEKLKEKQITTIMQEQSVSREEAEEIRRQQFRELGRRGGRVGGVPFKYNKELAKEAQILSVKSRKRNKNTQ